LSALQVNNLKGVSGTSFDSVVVPDSLGPVEPLPKYLEIAEDNEEAA
jgi:hypothetical protein